MRNIIICLLVVVVAILYFGYFSDVDTPENYLAKAGISGNHDLCMQHAQFPDGSMGEVFFSYSSIITSDSPAQKQGLLFSWWSTKENGTISTMVPPWKFKIVLVDSLTKPQVSFVLANVIRVSKYKEAITSPNSLLESDKLLFVKVYISRDMYANEPFLSQVREFSW